MSINFGMILIFHVKRLLLLSFGVLSSFFDGVNLAGLLLVQLSHLRQLDYTADVTQAAVARELSIYYTEQLEGSVIDFSEPRPRKSKE